MAHPRSNRRLLAKGRLLGQLGSRAREARHLEMAETTSVTATLYRCGREDRRRLNEGV